MTKCTSVKLSTVNSKGQLQLILSHKSDKARVPIQEDVPQRGDHIQLTEAGTNSYPNFVS